MFAHALLLVMSDSGSASQYFDWCFRYEEVFKAVNPESETFVHPNGLSFKDVLYNAYDNSYFPDQGESSLGFLLNGIGFNYFSESNKSLKLLCLHLNS